MKTCLSVADLRSALVAKPGPIGFVPTMGALHDGHASLLRRCRDECATAVASIYVNPTQFDEQEDLAHYPRDMDADAALLEDLGVDFLFAPTTLYADGCTTTIDAGPIGEVYEGAARPGHFAGVCTVVAKLFHIVGPDRAYFGQKDAQQLAVIRAMVSDLDMPVEVVGCPTARDSDGLAMSSRNAHLSRAERQQALGLGRGLSAAREAYRGGERDWTALEAVARDPDLAYDYLACVQPDRFTSPGPLLIAAARVGRTRLIDNLLLDR